MLLNLDQLRALAELKRRTMALQEAQERVHESERYCWRMGISDRQIGVIVGKSGSWVCRRRTALEAKEPSA